MVVDFDPEKRRLTLARRGLDFARAVEVFAGPTYNMADDRQAYGEARFMTFGVLDSRLVLVVWTPRGGLRRIISMRKANDREIARYGHRVGGPG